MTQSLNHLLKRTAALSTDEQLELAALLIDQARKKVAPSALDLTPVAELSDQEVLAVSKLRMDDVQGKRLGKLLDRQRTGAFDEAERAEMAALMQVYNECLVRKAQALAEAVRRGLREPLSQWARDCHCSQAQ